MELLERIVDALVGLPAWAAWIAIVLATFVSEDLTCIAAGLVAAGGSISAWNALGAAGLGIFLGDLLLYLAGAAFGRAALRRAPLAWIVHDEDVERCGAWFARRGPAAILIARFVPGSRLPTYVAAGIVRAGFWSFALYTLIAVAVWTPLLGGAAMLLGREVLPWVATYERWALPVLAGLVLGLWLAAKLVLPAFTWRGRRMLVSRWRRATRWEFWPPWLFYAPVFVYFVWLALRHRSVSVFTAVNPGVPAGGFVGESKSAILEALREQREFVARTRRIDAALSLEERMGCAAEFLAEAGLGYPIVLKPDAGQRGSGVAIVRSERELEAYLARVRVSCVVQEHVPGEEFGVFYYRHPGEPRGRIFSITRKVFPRVTGDGRRTLEELILFDARAVCMARFLCDKNAHRLYTVPAAGEEVQLAEIGNHCRGAIFLDGTALATRELEDRIERISRGFDGFYFGRYDVIAASLESFRAGRDFKIVELNGATAEATHIYDPANGLIAAYRVLFEQWRILFSIAAENARRGATIVRWPELVKMLSRYRVEARSHP